MNLLAFCHLIAHFSVTFPQSSDPDIVVFRKKIVQLPFLLDIQKSHWGGPLTQLISVKNFNEEICLIFLFFEFHLSLQ